MTHTMVLAGRTAALMTLLVTTQFSPRAACACPPRRGGPVYYPRPASVSTSAVAVAASAAPTQAEIVAKARQALRTRDYASALQLTDQALQRLPQNSELLQMKSLALMLKGEFQAAAVAAHSGLSTGVIFNRATLLALAPDEAEYTRQLQTLLRQTQAAPGNADLQFLLAYHEFAAGHVAEGRAALLAAREKLPNDKLISVLLSQLPATPAASDAAPSVAKTSPSAVEK